jgi:LDH2 family malate/lactate/ureidoglycolate dehydrogenase
MLTFSPQQLHATATAIFRAAGADEANTAIVADHLVDANLTGHDSHGVIRIPSYVRSIAQGQLAPGAKPEIVRETASMTLIDAHLTFGQVSALFATDAVVAKARQHGVAVAGTFHGTHIGRLGYFPTRAAAQGVALLVAYGSLGRSGAPFGGRTGALGTNPISLGFPVEDETPFLLDFATTAIAAGKVSVARDKHEQLPPNSMIDKDGQPTTDPDALSQGGALLPFGGHKGYALSLMAVLLSNVLVRDGAAAPQDAPGGEGGEGGGAKVFFCAIDTGIFGAGAPAAAAETLRRVRATPPAEGVEQVLIPGEPERRSAERRRAEGIPVAEDTWQAITATAAGLGVSI